jgi:hypothetical protein
MTILEAWLTAFREENERQPVDTHDGQVIISALHRISQRAAELSPKPPKEQTDDQHA